MNRVATDIDCSWATVDLSYKGDSIRPPSLAELSVLFPSNPVREWSLARDIWQEMENFEFLNPLH